MSLLRISGKPEDWTKWEKLIQQTDTCKELTDIEKEKAKYALLFLKQEFGEKFLEDAFEKAHPEESHPLLSYTVNSAPWTRKWLTRFSDALKSLKDVDGYSGLLKRLMDKKGFLEAESVLWVAYKLRKAGFKIVIDPLIVSNRRVPDLKIINEDTKEEVFIEISIQKQSTTTEKASITFDTFFYELSGIIFDHLTYCGRILKVLSDRHMSDVLKEVKDKIEKAKKEQSFQELIIEDTIELAIAPQKDANVLEIWAKSRGIKTGTFSGPPINVDEVRRTKATIQREQQQLPRTSPNILVIENGNLFRSRQGVRRAMNELEECLYDFPKLLFFIINDRYEGETLVEQNETFMKNQHIFTRRVIDEYNLEQAIVLLNRYCDFNVSPSTISKVYLAFSKN